ncbi:restriction endonuclease subunit S [Falsihalocynthiibacter sp. S25ZX9]|uniref:restriction endonuclease subunit S n=1 Tax=Falsihalocynthiibacter sp. S25ZX9 TaxID=3240870 RepID=UPI00350F8616
MSNVLGDYFDLQRGNTYKSKLLGQPGPVLLGLGSIGKNGGFRGEKLKTYGGHCDPRMILTPGDIYVSLKDVTQSAELLGAVARVPSTVPTGRVTQDTVKLLFKKGAPSDYIYWLLRTPHYRAYCRSHATGTTNLGLPREDFLAYPVPKLTKQKLSLVETIQLLDDKIELNRRMNGTLEEMARALFLDWFVDFGPTRRQMAGETDPTKIMGNAFPPDKAQTLAPLFPATLGEDGLPEGWKAAEISSLCDIKSGKRPPVKVNSPDHENSIPVWGGNGVSWFTNQTLFDQPLVITGRVGTLGTVYRVEGDVWVSDNALCLFPHDGYFELLYQSLQTLDYKALNSGSTQPLLTQTALKKQPCLRPPKETAQQFQEISSLMTKKVMANEKENETLAKTRDLLLPKLMSGEIRLKDVEGML